MVNLAVHRILAFGSIIAFSNAARCMRSAKSISCENADKGVIERLAVYYENDVNLIVRNSSIPILEIGMFGKLKFLEKLTLTRCEIRNIEDGVFKGLKLTHLNLAGNSMEKISDRIFSDLPNLKFLDLSYNLIFDLRLTAGVGYPPVLSYVDVSNNRLNNLTIVGNFSELETVNFENNTLSQFQTDYILHLPKIKEVFFGGNSFNKSYENFVTFVLSSCRMKIDFEKKFFDDVWKTEEKISTNSTEVRNSSIRPKKSDIEKDFKLSPELIKSLSPTELTNLVERILTLRNFTLTERNMLEMDRKIIQEESKSVKEELARVDQVIKRYEEVSREAKQESIGEYIEKSCQGMPVSTWWQRFKRWKCKKLFNWVNRLISR